MADVGDWYRHIPPFTKQWFSWTCGVSLIARFNLISVEKLILLYEPLARFEIWRLVTCLFFYPVSFHFLVNLYFLYTYSKKLETGVYASKPADYLFLLLFSWTCCIIGGLILGFPVLMDPMVMCVLYIWCQLHKDTIVTFWFGTRFKAMYFPWVLLAFNVIVGRGGITDIVGIVVGHLYFFLMFKYPQELGGPALLQTPSILKHWFPDQIGGVAGFGFVAPRRPANQENARGGGHNWGRGHTLGGN